MIMGILPLGIVVLGDGRNLFQELGCAVHALDSNSSNVHDGARGLKELVGLSGAGREAGVGKALVLDDEVLDQAFLGGDGLDGGEVNLSKLLNIDRTSILIDLVVVLRVVLENLGLLDESKVLDKVVDLELFPPSLTVCIPTPRNAVCQLLGRVKKLSSYYGLLIAPYTRYEGDGGEVRGILHFLCERDIKLSCSEESELLDNNTSADVPTPLQYIVYAVSHAKDKRTRVKVSNLSVNPSASSSLRSWATSSSCSGVVCPGWPAPDSGLVVG